MRSGRTMRAETTRETWSVPDPPDCSCMRELFEHAVLSESREVRITEFKCDRGKVLGSWNDVLKQFPYLRRAWTRVRIGVHPREFIAARAPSPHGSPKS